MNRDKVPLTRVSIDRLQSIVVSVLQDKLDLTKREAGLIFSEFLNAEQQGKETYGFVRVPWLVGLSGLKNEKPIKRKDVESISYYDCSNSIGYLAIDEVLNIECKTKSAVKTIVLQNLFPTGVIGNYTRRLTDKYLVVITSTTPAMVSFKGKKDAYFGTNPFALGFDSQKGESLYIDFATAPTTLGKKLVSKYYSSNKLGVNINEITQNLDTPLEVKQYLMMLGVQVITELFSGVKTNKGDMLIFLINKKKLGLDHSHTLELLNKIMPQRVPGVRKKKDTSKTVVISKKLLDEITSLGSS